MAADEDDEPFELAPAPPPKRKTDRRWLTAAALAACAAILVAGLEFRPATTPVSTTAGRGYDPMAEPWRAAVIAELKSGETVRDALWAGPSSLWIGVTDDGSRRDGFARYACDVVVSHRPNASEKPFATVWDIAKMTIGQEMVELGKQHCR